MRTKRSILSLICVCLMVCAVGCSVSRQAIVKDRYLIQAQRTGDAEMMTDAVVMVMPFTIAPEFESNGFVYRIGSSKYETDYYNEYYIPPAQMIGQQVQDWLASSGIAMVVPPTSAAEPQFQVEGTVRKLYADVQESLPPKAVLEISFVILDQEKGDSQIRFSKVYHEETGFVNHTAAEYVQAMNQSLRQVLMRLEKDIRDRAAQ